MNVFPSAICDVLMKAFQDKLTGYIQVVKANAEQVRFDEPISVDVEVVAASPELGTLKDRIEEQVRGLLAVRIDANLVSPGSIERTVYKSPLVRVEKKPQARETGQ